MDKIIKSIQAAYPQYANNIPTHEKNIELVKRIQQNDKEAETELICRHIGLIAKMTNKFYFGNAKEDAFIVAMEGMLNAARRYNKDIGSFSTYASIWIKQSIQREIYSKDVVIRLPEHCRLPALKYKKLVHNKELNIYSDEQLAEFLDVSYDTLKIIKNYYTKTILSMDEPVPNVSGDCDSVFGDYIKDDSLSVEDEVLNNLCFNEVEKIMHKILSEKEIQVVQMRFGLLDGKVYTLQEIGDIFVPPVSRERIRQLENMAIWKLRKNPFITQIMKHENPALYKAAINSAPGNAQANISYKKGKVR